MNSINISFKYAWLLLLLIPVIALALRPYFGMPPKNRRMKNRVVSLVIHIVISIALILVLAGIQIERSYVATKSDVIILVDKSASTDTNQAVYQQKIETIVSEIPSDYRLGFVLFAQDSISQVKLTTNHEEAYENYATYTFDENQSATKIEDALLYAFEELNVPEQGRIILLSDGIQTEGNSLAAAKNISSLGTRVDVLYVEPTSMANDAQITNVFIPSGIQIGIDTEMSIQIDSTMETSATLHVEYINESDESINESIELDIVKGLNQIQVIHAFNDFGVTQIKFDLVTEEVDTRIENNVSYAFINIDRETTSKLMIIEGVEHESDSVNSILTDVGYDIDVYQVNNLPTSINTLIQYREIILMNVKNSDLVNAGFQNILESYVKNYGGGLLAIGGNRAYQKEDMIGDGVDTTFSNLLPLESSTDPKAMAVVIVMDASGSMTSNGSTKLQLAKSGAIASLEALASQNGETSHQFGLVTFDANLKDVIEMTSVSNKDSIIPQINDIESGSGTQYIQGLQKAKEMLNDSRFDNAQKHIIFLTDGGPQDDETQYMSLINSMDGISLSAIALGVEGENDLDPAKVEAMVKTFNGRGNYYRVENENQLYNVMLDDTQQAQSGDFINEVPFTGIINQVIPAISSISTMPELDGYYGTRIKSNANLVVETEQGDPLFAIWIPDGGTGRVASFTSDLSGQENSFSYTFNQDFIGKAFIRGMVASVLPSNDIAQTDMNMSFIENNYETGIRVRTNLNDGEVIQAQITNPNGDVIRVPLSTISKTTFGGSFNNDASGLYELNVFKYDSQGNVISELIQYHTFSYSSEYSQVYDYESAIYTMEKIAENGQGAFLHDLDDIFSEEFQTITQELDMTVILILFLMILFLIDIVIRKFKFKWSHEYFGKKYESSHAIQ